MNTNLTNQMTQLVGEIASLREARAAFRVQLGETCSQMREGFQTARAEMAGKMNDDLREFTSGLREQVANLRDAFAGDLAGARQAWYGSSGMAAPPSKARAAHAEEPVETYASKARKKKR